MCRPDGSAVTVCLRVTAPELANSLRSTHLPHQLRSTQLSQSGVVSPEDSGAAVPFRKRPWSGPHEAVESPGWSLHAACFLPMSPRCAPCKAHLQGSPWPAPPASPGCRARQLGDHQCLLPRRGAGQDSEGSSGLCAHVQARASGARRHCGHPRPCTPLAPEWPRWGALWPCPSPQQPLHSVPSQRIQSLAKPWPRPRACEDTGAVWWGPISYVSIPQT